MSYSKLEEEKWAGWLNAMQAMHAGLSDNAKERLAKASEGVVYNTPEQIESALKVTKIFDLMNAL